MIRWATNLFALWTVLGTAWAWFIPDHFLWVVDGRFTPLGQPLVSVLLLAVLLLHIFGFGLGYGITRALGFGVTERRTISIEVGMQNSGLGSSLASTPGFAAQFATSMQAALAPVPSAISAVYHVVIGSFLAAIWRRQPVEIGEDDDIQ